MTTDVAARRRRGLRPPSTAFVVRASVAVVALNLLVFAAGIEVPTPGAAAILLALAAACYLAVWATPALLVSLGLAATIFSGNSDQLGLPIGPDRLLVVAGLGSLAMGLPGAVDRTRAIVWRPHHAILAAVAAIATVSAGWAGTLATTEGLFALLDRLGIVPFVVFTLGPLIFSRERDRNVLLAVLVGTGAYLGVVAVLEGIGWDAFVFPAYITDPDIGLHYGRARGPFVESVAMGLALYGCAVAAAVAFVTWSTRRSRRIAAAVALLCLVGTIFTLTRAVWLGTVVATALALLANSRTRRVMAPITAVAVTGLVLALALVPGFSDRITERSNDQRPLWDRYNTNRAALTMVRENALTGVGWQRFREEAPDAMQVADDYPLTGVGIEVHNVFLSHAAELGVLGGALWLLSLALAIGGAILRPGPESLDPWRLGTVALAIHWLIVASFGPLSYAFPNLLLWTWAGVASLGFTSRLLTPQERVALQERVVVP